MESIPREAIAVIFVSQRIEADPHGYATAAEEMDRESRRQRGYLGMDSTRDAKGFGITVSYWASLADAEAWRDHFGHAAIREKGRARWYSAYRLTVAEVERSYCWSL